MAGCEQNRLDMSWNSSQQAGDLHSRRRSSPQHLWPGSLWRHGTSDFGIQLPITALSGLQRCGCQCHPRSTSLLLSCAERKVSGVTEHAFSIAASMPPQPSSIVSPGGLKITTGFILASFSMPPEPLVYPQTRFSGFFFNPANMGVETESVRGHLTSRSRDHSQDVTTWLMGRTSPGGPVSPSPAATPIPLASCAAPPSPKTCSMATCNHALLWDPHGIPASLGGSASAGPAGQQCDEQSPLPLWPREEDPLLRLLSCKGVCHGDGCLWAGCCRSGQQCWMCFQGNRQAACTGMRSEGELG